MTFAHLPGFCGTAMAPGGPVIVALAAMGLASGFTHCAAMCGPLLLTRRQPMIGGQLVAFQGGRICAYALLGAASAMLSRLLVAERAFHLIATVLLSAAAVLFAATAMPASRHLLNRLLHFGWRPVARFLFRVLNRLRSHMPVEAPVYPFAMGALLGFMPCGMILGALLALSATGSAWLGAFGMAVFVLATTPGIALLGVAGVVVQNRHTHLMRPLQQASLGLSACVFATQAYHMAV